MTFLRKFTWLFGSKTAIIMVSFFTGALINRALGPTGRGIFAEIQTWVYLFIVIFGFSLDSAIYHFANRQRYPIDDGTRLVTIIFLNTFLSLLAVGFLTIFNSIWTQHFSNEFSLLLHFVNILLGLTLIANNLIVFIQALDWIKQAAVIGILQTAVNVLIISTGYFLTIIDLKFVILNLIVIQAATIFALFYLFIKNRLLHKTKFSLILAGGMIKSGLKQHIASVSTFVYTKVNQLILFKYCGEHETGIYAVALNLAFSAIIIPTTFQTVLYPRVIHAEDDYEVTIRSLRLGLYVWGIMVLVIIAAAKPLLILYGGSKFLESVKIFQILMVAVWLLPLSSLLSPYYIKAGAFMMASATAVILGTISIVLNLYLVPKYLAVGAALATALSCTFGFILVVLFLWYLSRQNPLVIFKPDFSNEMRTFANWGGKIA
jgi:O-antigen/teichoic acid export membrane protein